MSSSDKYQNEPKWVRFITGGAASSTAEICTLPIDTIKVRLQIQTGQAGASGPLYNGVFDTLKQIVRQEKVSGLWKGLGPAVLRQASYSGIRMGIYEPIRDLMIGKGNTQATYFQKLLAGGTAGGIGIAIANPTDLIKIRMQADRAGTRYKGTIHAFQHIVQHEGLLGLWTGVGPAVQRAVIVNAAELATYDHSKHTLVQAGFHPEKVTTHFAASFIAGFFAALASSPVDVIKNRLMSQSSVGSAPSTAAATEVRYTGMLDCAMKTVKSEGPMALYKGFIPNWFRLGPWCIVMFMSYEQYRNMARRYWDPSYP